MIRVNVNTTNDVIFHDADDFVTVGGFLHLTKNHKLIAIFKDWIYVEIAEDEN